MKSFLLMSVLLASFAIPALASRQRSPGRAVRQMIALLVLFNLVYVVYLALLHPVLFVPQR